MFTNTKRVQTHEHSQLCSLSQLPCRVSGVLGATQAEIEHHLEMGRKLLAAGQLAEALSHYHSAVGKITHIRTLTFGSLLHEVIHFHTDVSRVSLNSVKISLVCTEGDSKNYLTFYKRAAVFLAMGKSKSALPDLTRAIQLKPDFMAVSLNPQKCVHHADHVSISFLYFSFHLCNSRPDYREGTSF